MIDTQLGPGGLRFVDAPDVEDFDPERVVIAVAAADVGSLPEPSANPAVMEHGGDKDSESALAQKLRRAWAMITGDY